MDSNCVDGERVVGINIQIHHECRSISNGTVARHPDALSILSALRGVRVPNLSSKYRNTLFDVSLHNITRILHTFLIYIFFVFVADCNGTYMITHVLLLITLMFKLFAKLCMLSTFY